MECSERTAESQLHRLWNGGDFYTILYLKLLLNIQTESSVDDFYTFQALLHKC